jgi:hypothetical protein
MGGAKRLTIVSIKEYLPFMLPRTLRCYDRCAAETVS